MSNPEGRPRIPINQQEFEKLCNMLCTEEEIAGWFNCSVDTIARWCHETYGETFRDAFAKLSSRGKISIRRKQFEVAQSGNVGMLIWLGKQVLGQKDKTQLESDVNMNAKVEGDLKVSRVDLDERVKQLKGETKE